MTHHSIALDLGAALAPPRRCPSCLSFDLTPVHDEQGVLFLCPRCRRTWFSELGALVPVENRPATGRPVPHPREEPAT